LPDRGDGPRARRRSRPSRRAARDVRRPRNSGRRSRRGRAPWRRRPALAGLRELRPVSRLRATRRGVQAARAEPFRVKRGHLESNVLVLVTLALVAFGMVMVYSATSASATIGGGNPVYYLKRQAIFAVIGLVALVVVRRWNYRSLRHAAPVLVFGSVFLLVIALGGGQNVTGARP